MANIAYIRVLSGKETIEEQTQFFIDEGITIDKAFHEIVEERYSTTHPDIQDMLDYIQEGDKVHIESIDRIARNTKEFLNVVKQLDSKAVSLVSVREKIDTTTEQGRFMLDVFTALMQLDRVYMRARQAEGIALALKDPTRSYGRPKVKLPPNSDQVINEWRDGKIKAVEAIKKLGMKKTTFYKRLR